MKKHIQGFAHGINQDISTNKYPNTNFYWAQNFRLVSKDGLATGALTNVEGTSPKVSVGGGQSIIGTCLIRDTLVMFVASDEGGKIYIWNYNSNDFMESPVLVYHDPDLDFNTDKPIRAVGRYETAKIQKVYFTDGESFFKHLNIIPEEDEGYPLDYPVDSLDLVSDIDFSTIDLEIVEGGNLKAGKIQYAYQLYSKRGSESVYSPTSQIIHITEADSTFNSSDYYGSEKGEIVNKSINVSITNPDPLFTRLRLVALEYTVLSQIPSVRIVGEYNIEDLTELTVSDTGSSIGELTLEEFRLIQNNFFPKALDIKNDYLFAANIKTDYFEITDDEFDARAFRANASDEIVVYNGSNEIPVNLSTPSTLPNVKTEQFNSFNDLQNDYKNNDVEITLTEQQNQYKFKPDSSGTILGGKGINIEYEFITNEVILDDSPRTNDWGEGYPRLNIGVNPPYENNASPLSKVGYQRDEIYRFGIVFFDKKGRQSFVKWIGDIRFPSNRDSDDNGDYGYVYYDSDNNRTIARILGIKFNVNIPSSIEEKISGYQIVRAERTNSDKTIYSQGLVGFPVYTSVGLGADVDHRYSMATPPTAWDMTFYASTTERATENYPTVGDRISGQDKYQESNSSILLDSTLMEFDSPETTFNKSKYPLANAYLDVFGWQDEIETLALSGGRGYEDFDGDGTPDLGNDNERDIMVADKPRNFNYTPLGRFKANVEFQKLFTPKSRGNASAPDDDATKVVLENGTIYNNQAYAPSSDTNAGNNFTIKSKWGLRGTHMVFGIKDSTPSFLTWAATGLKFPMANYKVYKGRSIYGGSSYEARTSTKYYPASEFIKYGGSLGDIEEVEREETLSSFTITYSDLPVNVCSSTNTTTVYANNTKPQEGDILYKDSGLTEPWDIAGGGFFKFDSPAIYGDEVFGLAINPIAGTSQGEILRQSGDIIYTCGDTSGYADVNSDGTINVFGGDTYISYFAYLRSLYDKERANGYRIESKVFYPAESTININLRSDQIQDYINWGFYRDNRVTDYKLMENASNGVLSYGLNYPTDLGNLYRYNSAYSCMDKSKEFFPKPFDFTSTLTNDVRITASEKKINGEYIDSWTIFKFNNYIDVDSKHNEIVKLITFKNNLFYFQPTAVGIASVNDRSLIQDGQAGQLTLGTGGILPRYDYVTDKSGSEYYEAILASDDFLFYADGRRKRINKLVPGKEVAVSIVKGIDSTLDKLSWENVRAGFDRGYNEVIFAIDDKTLAFSESADAFVSHYTFHPGLMFSINKDFFSVAEEQDESPWLYNDLQTSVVGYSNDANNDYIIIGPSSTSNTLYQHNVGEPGKFYGGGEGEDSYLTLIINPMGNTVCYFDNLDLRTESTLNGVDDPDDVFYRLESSNNYQEMSRELAFLMNQTDPTKGYTYNKGSIKRIGRKWRTPIMPQYSGTTYSRMVDTYLKVTLRYSNTGNEFRVHDVITYYRPSNH